MLRLDGGGALDSVPSARSLMMASCCGLGAGKPSSVGMLNRGATGAGAPMAEPARPAAVSAVAKRILIRCYVNESTNFQGTLGYDDDEILCDMPNQIQRGQPAVLIMPLAIFPPVLRFVLFSDRVLPGWQAAQAQGLFFCFGLWPVLVSAISFLTRASGGQAPAPNFGSRDAALTWPTEKIITTNEPCLHCAPLLC